MSLVFEVRRKLGLLLSFWSRSFVLVLDRCQPGFNFIELRSRYDVLLLTIAPLSSLTDSPDRIVVPEITPLFSTTRTSGS